MFLNFEKTVGHTTLKINGRKVRVSHAGGNDNIENVATNVDGILWPGALRNIREYSVVERGHPSTIYVLEAKVPELFFIGDEV
jgi:hypothetical protein